MSPPNDTTADQSRSLCRQIEAIVARDQRYWSIASSRRTPETTLRTIAQHSLVGASIVPWNTVDRDWLREQLAMAAVIWVSEDSVSMVYEALSSGAKCGLLSLPAVKATRVMNGIARMLAAGMLVYADDWLAGTPMPSNAHPLNEARRCARLITRRWYSNRHPG